jgi:pSer/pThr/pTyr-binding forkhead associated (FHA) protein
MASYSLEFLNQSGSRSPGTTETIVVPHAEMGRDRSCAIRFDSTEKTVSRKHASISMENGQYFITPLSQTNQTFVNGSAINGRYPLTNGSEIQLSSSGPRMRFLASQTRTSAMRLTQRMQMFASQSLRPYRTAVVVLAVVLVGSLSGMSYMLYRSDKQIDVLITENKVSKAAFETQLANQKKNKKAQDILTATLKDLDKQLTETKKKLEEETKANAAVRKQVELESSIKKALDVYENDVYYVHMSKIIYRAYGEVEVINNIGSGTGFLLDDGRFVTALHVAEPWYFPSDESDYILNALKTQGSLVELTLVATSPSGQQFTISSNDFHYNEAALERRVIEIGYNEYMVKVNSNNSWHADWAWLQTNLKGKIKADPELSENMEDNAKVYALGYTFGLSQQPKDKLNPLHSTMLIAQDGLTKGVIKVSGRSFDHGNSGGPVFAVNKNGELVNIGIVSHGREVVGGIVPIANLK